MVVRLGLLKYIQQQFNISLLLGPSILISVGVCSAYNKIHVFEEETNFFGSIFDC